jgi:hypothetical protein
MDIWPRCSWSQRDSEIVGAVVDPGVWKRDGELSNMVWQISQQTKSVLKAEPSSHAQLTNLSTPQGPSLRPLGRIIQPVMCPGTMFNCRSSVVIWYRKLEMIGELRRKHEADHMVDSVMRIIFCFSPFQLVNLLPFLCGNRGQH